MSASIAETNLPFQFNFICIALNHHYSLKGLNRPNIYDDPDGIHYKGIRGGP